MAEDDNEKLAKRISERYRNYADLIQKYSDDKELQLNEAQSSLLERVIEDELLRKESTLVRYQDSSAPLLNEPVDYDYLKSLAKTTRSGRDKAIATRMLNALLYSHESPVNIGDGVAKNKHLLESYNHGKKSLCRIRLFGESCFDLLKNYLVGKGLIQKQE